MKVEFGRLIDVVADKEWSETHQGGASFCRLLFFDDTFYVFVLSGRAYYVRGFDPNWQFTGFEKKLTSEGDVDVDQDIAFDGEHVYEYIDLNGPKGRVRKFDKKFNLIKETPIITTGPEEEILDQNLALINGKIYAGSEYRENGILWRKDRPHEMSNMPPNTEVNRGMRLRIYDKELNTLGIKDLVANISGAVVPNQYWALGASQLYADNYYCVVAASPIGNNTYFDHGESLGARQIFILRFDDDFNFVDSKGPLSDTNNDNLWCTGSWYEDGKYYIAYCVRRPGDGCQPGPGRGPPRPRRPRIQGQEAPRPGGPDTFRPRPRPQSRPETTNRPREPGFRGMGNIFLSIFDEKFKELKTVALTNATVGKGPAGNRPKILKINNKLFVTYDSDRKSYVQELIIKE